MLGKCCFMICMESQPNELISQLIMKIFSIFQNQDWSFAIFQNVKDKQTNTCIHSTHEKLRITYIFNKWNIYYIHKLTIFGFIWRRMKRNHNKKQCQLFKNDLQNCWWPQNEEWSEECSVVGSNKENNREEKTHATDTYRIFWFEC